MATTGFCSLGGRDVWQRAVFFASHLQSKFPIPLLELRAKGKVRPVWSSDGFMGGQIGQRWLTDNFKQCYYTVVNFLPTSRVLSLF